MKYARVISGIAYDVRGEEPTGFYAPEVAAQFEVVPDAVENGWLRNGNDWTAPEPVVPPAPQQVYPRLTPLEFKMCFTAGERIAIKGKKSTDPIISDAYEILDDPRLQTVDLNLDSNRALIDYLVSVGCISAARSVEIKAGKQL